MKRLLVVLGLSLLSPWAWGVSYPLSDERWQVKFGGRLHVDSGSFYNAPERYRSGDKLRRSRLSFGVDFDRQLRLNLDYDLNDEQRPINALSLGFRRGAWRTRAGQFMEPFGLENSTSSNDILLMERSLITVLMPGINVGAALAYGRRDFTVTGGLFRQSYIGDERPLDADNERAVTLRLTRLFEHRDGAVSHVGLSLSQRQSDESYRLRFRARPESYLTDEKPLSTRRMRGVERYRHAALEFAYRQQAFSLQAEWIDSRVFFQKAGRATEPLRGGYLTAAYTLTGEVRRYSRSRGVLTSINPGKRPAWELVLRQSQLDLNGYRARGGRMAGLTLGLNHYVNDNLRWMVNYLNIESDARAGDLDFNVFQMRLQVTL